jgi:hypothetical protein
MGAPSAHHSAACRAREPHLVEVLGAEAPDRQARHAPGVQALDLLGQMAHGLEARHLDGAPDEIEHRIAPDLVHGAIALGPEHAEYAAIVRIVGDDHKRGCPTCLPAPPCTPELGLLAGRGAGILDTVHKTAL